MANIKIRPAFYGPGKEKLNHFKKWNISFHSHDRQLSNSDKNLKFKFPCIKVGFRNTF